MSIPVGDGEPISIVLIEDDPGDVMLTRDALAEYKVRNELTVLADGTNAIAFLRAEGRHAGRPFPDLILLDLNLPGVSGREVFSVMRSDPALSRIPVVVLTSSDVDEDLLRSQALGAAAFLRKPVDFGGLAEVVRRVETFYLRLDRATAL
jgi:CheY-like chemotaxis protein